MRNYLQNQISFLFQFLIAISDSKMARDNRMLRETTSEDQKKKTSDRLCDNRKLNTCRKTETPPKVKFDRVMDKLYNSSRV